MVSTSMKTTTTNGHVNGYQTKSQASLVAFPEPFATHARIEELKASSISEVIIDGQNLTIGEVVAVARHGAKATISPSVHQVVQDSVDLKESKTHTSIYGVTTGFGGSADTRTADTEALQKSLLEHQLSGFLPTDASYDQMLLHAMPIAIVRGAMIVRVNSCVRGHSGVRLRVLQAILNFLNLGLVPCVPLRGTISASGDLSPLSYIAASICGHPDVKIFETTTSSVLSATEAIAKYTLPTVSLAAKEGLGLINGTAVSASAGALALYDAECLALMTQTVTAMTVEALAGQVGSFHPFIHDEIRPHEGQIQAARNIRTMLQGSKLAVHREEEVAIEEDAGILRQDRYALRTSAQWIGPQLESLVLARKQIEVELNSTTDNPLIDVRNRTFHHGGNFQAMAVTSAMDATRIALQNLGRLSFAQLTELINCNMSHGLPSNLAGSEPSTNYHCKGLDIHAAAYCSELGFLANPVSSHVQSTEMHNQSVNSLAFISARKTLEANDILSLLLASHLYCVTQGIDLRIFSVKFETAVKSMLEQLLSKHFSAYMETKKMEDLRNAAFIALLKRLEHTCSWDSGPRFEDAAKHLVGTLLESLHDDAGVIAALNEFKAEFAVSAAERYRELRDEAMASGKDSITDAKEFLGRTSAMYQTIRVDLGIAARRGDVADGKSGKSIGGNVSKIVEAIRQGRLINAVSMMTLPQRS